MEFKWSPTLFRYASGCSRRFWSYINNEPITNVNREFQDGARAHSAIEQYLKTRESVFLEGFPASVKRDLDLLLRYDGVLYTEQELEDEEFEGVADIVIEQSDRWIIIDVKSRYETALEREDYFQLYTYLYLLQKEQYKPEAMVGIFACWNSYNCLGLQHVALVEPFELREYLHGCIDSAQRNIESNRINISHCRYCQYLHSCDVPNIDPQSIEDVARKYVYLKFLVDNYEMQLREHVNKTGKNIIADDLEIGFHMKNKTNVDTERLIEALDLYGIPLSQAFVPSITKIRQLAKKNDDIANCISIEQDYEFSIKKIKSESW